MSRAHSGTQVAQLREARLSCPNNLCPLHDDKKQKTRAVGVARMGTTEFYVCDSVQYPSSLLDTIRERILHMVILALFLLLRADFLRGIDVA